MNINWKKTAGFFLVVFFAGLLTVKGIVPAWRTVNSDFANYYVSARLIVDKVPLDSLYNNAWFQGKIKEYGIETPGKFSPFPPITAWLMIPLTPFEPLVAQRIFTGINLLFIVLGIVVLQKLTSWSMLQNAFVMLGCGLGLTNNIAFGQVYLIMTVFILISFLLGRQNYFLLPGFILGLFTSVKYFPIVLIAGLLLNGILDVPGKRKSLGPAIKNPDIKIAFYSILSLIALSFFQYFYFGKMVMSEFISSSFLPHLDGELSGQGLFSYQFQSWDNFSRNLFVHDELANPHPFMNWPGGKIFFKLAVGFLVVGLTSFVLYRFRSFPSPIRRPVFLSLPALGALVLLPASATYHFIFLISSLVLIFQEYYLSKKIRILILINYILIGLIPYSLFFSLAKTYGLLFAYPRLWLITCLFLLVVAGLLKTNRSLQS